MIRKSLDIIKHQLQNEDSIFSKYQGTGNDFIIIDNRNKQYDSLSNEQVKSIVRPSFWNWSRWTNAFEQSGRV